MKYIAVLILTALLASCGEVTNEQKEYLKKEESQNLEDSEIVNFKQKEISIDIKDSEVVKITLDSENTKISSDAVQVSGQKITIKKSWNYEFSWTLTDGQIVVETTDEKDVQIILNNVEITNSQSSAIFVANAEQTVINLADGSSNIVTDASSYNNTWDIEANAAIFSHDDLVFTGEWELTINANYKDWITSKDKLFIESWKISITSEDDWIRWKDYLQIDWGEIAINAQWDWLKADNEEKGTIIINNGEVIISAWDDAINASQFLVINDWVVTVEKSYEALESRDISLNGWIISLTSSDDGINVSSWGETEVSRGESQDIFLRINGWSITVDAEWDGLDSNGNIIMTGWEVVVYWPTQDNNWALDYDGDFIISGWSLLAIWSSWMASAPWEDSSQNSVLIGLESAYSAWDTIIITTNTWTEIFTITSTKSFQAIAISSADIIIWEEYIVEINWSEVQTFSPTDVVTTFWEIWRGWRRWGR